MTLDKVKSIHFMGIGGSGTSVVAELALVKGFQVSGCDLKVDSSYTEGLVAKNVSLSQGHSPAHLEGVDLLAISRAIVNFDPNNPEIIEAKKKGIPVVQWQAVLDELMSGYFSIGISGTHGKGTTAGLLATILTDAGCDPTFEVGANIAKLATNFRVGKGKHFVFEADEYAGNFLYYHPKSLVVTNLEFDHPDCFSRVEDVVDLFEKLIRGMPQPATLIVNVDSPGVSTLLERLKDWEGKIITFSLESKSNFQATGVLLGKTTAFKLPSNKTVLVPLPGKHNVYNALAAIAAASSLGISEDEIIKSLATFEGMEGRFDIRGEYGGVTIIDDYAHHPEAIRVTLTTAREVFPGNRIWCVFQPHMYSRTKALFIDFTSAFCSSPIDHLIITDIYAAREKDEGIIHAKDLAEAVSCKGVQYIKELEEVSKYLLNNVQKGDVVIIMGAGDIYEVSDELIEKLKAQEVKV